MQFKVFFFIIIESRCDLDQVMDDKAAVFEFTRKNCTNYIGWPPRIIYLSLQTI